MAKRLTETERQERCRASLTRAVTGASIANYVPIFEGFAAMGIPEDQIMPRENVFTYAAWRALGRQVRKGEHGVKVITRKECAKTIEKDGEETVEAYSIPWGATVFHVSQTDPVTP